MSVQESAFSSFLSEFRTLSSSLSSQLSHVPDESTLTGQRAALSQAEGVSDEVSELLSSTEPELRHYPYSLRTKAQSQLAECQSQFDTLQSTLSRYQQSLSSGRLIPSSNPRADLLGPAAGQTAEQRRLLLSSRAALQDGDASLDNTTRMLAEAADVGAQTSVKLVEQREQFGAQVADLEDTAFSLSSSRRTLRGMAVRVFTNKLISAGIVLALVSIFILIAYLKYWVLVDK